MLKPFLVSIELEVAIFAESEDDVRHHPELRQAIDDAVSYPGDCITSVQPLKRIPDGWEEDYLVYGADGDVTVKEALNWDKKDQPPEDKHTMMLPFADK